MTTDPGVQRFRILAGCIVMAAVAFVQQPGRIVADTKLDLAVDPWGFLSRAATMWDADGFFGQIQNQAYGYLFPMGPFFGLGYAADVSPWIVQRLWWTLLLCLAFVGMVRLCAALGIGSPGLQIVAGVLFALSPRMLTVIGPSSVEMWPSALAPWVLVPLVIGLRRGSPRRQAGLSALAVACVGGVNAAATFAVVPLAAMLLLLAPRSPRRRTLMLWWPPLVLLGTLWWIGPLLLLGGYSPPFLDYIESASITTSNATLLDALRGSTNWVPYVSDLSVAGRAMISDPLVILNTGVLVVLALIGLVRRDLPYRSFLLLGMLLGTVLVTLGHTGAVEGLFAEHVQRALDGVLAPLRNTHKFDVVVRIPMVIAAVHAVTVMRRAVAGDERETRLRRVAVALITTAVLVGGTTPAWSAQLPHRGSAQDVPGYWSEAAQWLAEQKGEGTALMVPSSGFADYLWGSTGDEPLQPLAESAWAVRNSVPLTRGATIRLLDALGDQLASGGPVDGLDDALRRTGISHLVVRSDLRPDAGGDRSEVIRRTLTSSPGVERVAEFGPEVGGEAVIDLKSERTFTNGGWTTPRPAIEVFEVSSGTRRSATVSTVPTVVGDAATLPWLERLGVLGPGPVLTAGDRPADVAAGPLLVTDGQRRQEFGFGSVERGRSATLSEADAYSMDRRVHDYVEPDEVDWQTRADLRGAVSLEASSSRSEAGTVGGSRPSLQPWSAFDGDERSRWESAESTGTLTLRLPAVTDLGTVRITSGVAPGVRQELSVETEDGPVSVSTFGGEPVSVGVGEVGELTVSGRNLDDGRLAIAEIDLGRHAIARPLVLPDIPRELGAADTIVLGLAPGIRPACLEVEDVVRCRADQAERGEDAWSMDRELAVSPGGDYDVSIRTTPVGGRAYDELVQQDLPVRVTTSSSLSDDVRTSASAMIDGDRGTSWVAHPDDKDPTITVEWDEPQTFQTLRLPLASTTPASRTSRVVMESDGGRQDVVELDGTNARLDRPLTTSRVVIRLESARDARESEDGVTTFLPVGVGELGFGGLDLGTVPSRADRIELPCGSGPTLYVDDEPTRTAVTTTWRALTSGRDASAEPCEAAPVTLRDGTSRVRSTASQLFETGQTVLTRRGAVGGGEAGPMVVGTAHNANPGWTAVADDQGVEPLRVDGWQQGWLVPGGPTTDVEESFSPDALYRAALLGGALAVLLLLSIIAWPIRRAPSDETAHTGRRLLPAAVAAVGGLALLAGPLAVLLLLPVWGAVALARRRGWPVEAVAAVPVVPALMAYLISPWGTDGTWAGLWAWPQWAVLLGLSVVVVDWLLDPGLRRRNGVST